jgi:hypothetical protein
VRTHINTNHQHSIRLRVYLVIYDLRLHLRVRDPTTWFLRCVGTAFEHFPLGSHNSCMVTAIGSYDQGELAFSCRWTGWAWDITGWSSRLHENYRSFLRRIYRICPNLTKENWRISTCNRLNLQTLGSQPVMPKNLPNHCLARVWRGPYLSLMNTRKSQKKLTLQYFIISDTK